MEIDIFIENYAKAFGEAAALPVVFWYSDAAMGVSEKITGCFFKCMHAVRSGEMVVSLNADSIGCGGGKYYAGFTDMPEHVPAFVSLKEKYKKTPEMVLESIAGIDRQAAIGKFLNFARIDKVENVDTLEGVIFFATPDILSGLTTWAFYDNNSPDTVTALFGSGCTAIVANVVRENRNQGRRTFLGLFDPSVRPFFEPDVLSFAVPMSRFREMYDTMAECCLFNTHAWEKVKKRIND